MGCDDMRRLICFILCICFLVIPVKGNSPETYVALTFDDGPSGRFTRRLLEGLEERGVKATFLLCGYRLKDYPDTARKIFEAGHEIGLHGYSHKDMGKMTQAEAQREIDDTMALLPSGCKPVFLRTPGGSSGEGVTRAAKNRGLALLTWSVDPKDWANHDAAAVEAAVVESVRDGDIILLHDMTDCSVDAALAIIDRLHAQGVRFVTVSELAKIKGTVPRAGITYNRFR